MKRLSVVILLGCLLSGCMRTETFEIMGSVSHEQELSAPVRAVQLDLPESACAQTFAENADAVYECDGYLFMLQTVPSGDLQATIKQLSGFLPQQLTVVETMQGDLKRYDWIWTAAAEAGEMINRAAILDDGSYHYCLCVFADAYQTAALAEEWNVLFSSFGLAS